MFNGSYGTYMPLKVYFLVFQCLHNHFFCPFMDLHCFKWKIGITICDFVFVTEILPKFCLNFALFAYLRSPTAHLCLSKYIFGIVLFAQPFFQSIYGFTVYQMENWPQNWRFCIFDLNFTQFLHFLHVWERLRPTFTLQSLLSVLHCLHNHFSAHLCIYSVSNGKLASK